jgi:hypothetical protein
MAVYGAFSFQPGLSCSHCKREAGVSMPWSRSDAGDVNPLLRSLLLMFANYNDTLWAFFDRSYHSPRLRHR